MLLIPNDLGFKKYVRLAVVRFMSLTFLLGSCLSKKEEHPIGNLGIPPHFPPLPASTSNLEVSPDGIELGKMLFFDPILSGDSTISCATCHIPQKAFSDAGNAVSKGINELKGVRNAPALFNLMWKPLFFHDGGARSLEMQAVAPIVNPVEMGNDLKKLLKKLNNHPVYKIKFKKVFNVDVIQTRELVFALAMFERTIISAQSKYDRVVLGRDKFSDLELKGYQLFEKKCAICHQPPLFSNFSFVNNGLDDTFPSLDYDSDNEMLGRARVTQDTKDIGKYMVPSLRNVMVTHPYMHDGRFQTIEQVLEHYNSGIKPSKTLDPILMNGIALNDSEKEALIQFLHTLTDYELLNRKF